MRHERSDDLGIVKYKRNDVREQKWTPLRTEHHMSWPVVMVVIIVTAFVVAILK